MWVSSSHCDSTQLCSQRPEPKPPKYKNEQKSKPACSLLSISTMPYSECIQKNGAPPNPQQDRRGSTRLPERQQSDLQPVSGGRCRSCRRFVYQSIARRVSRGNGVGGTPNQPHGRRPVPPSRRGGSRRPQNG